MLFPLCAALLALGAEPTVMPDTLKTAKEALQPFNGLIASWKGTGYPEGTREERAKGFWVEKLEWTWHFEGVIASLKLTVTGGKHFKGGELRYLPKTHQYELALLAPDKSEQIFVGTLSTGKQKETVLTVERTVGSEVQQITLTMLHGNRYLYQLATKPKDAKSFTCVWQVGATKEGEPFAELNKGPECIVSGGRGTMSVSYKGKTYFVCCSGCKDEFNADPEKYIKLAAEKK